MGQAIIGFLTSPFSVIGVLISFGFFVGYVIVKLKHLDSQVSNHIPTEIKEVRTEIKEVRTEIKEVRTELNNRIDILGTKIDSNYKELSNRLDNDYKELSNKMDNNHNELKNFFIEYLGKK